MSLQALLEELKQTYLDALPARLILIDSLWQKGELELLETEYHKFKGTGRTYGLPEISIVGEALEKICGRRPAALPVAVPLSITLIHDLRNQRLKGETPVIESHADFQKISQILGGQAL